MKENNNHNFNHLYKICNLIKSLTHLDICAFNHQGNQLVEQVDHPLPAALKPLDHEEWKEELSNSPLDRYYYNTNTFGLEYIASAFRMDNSFKGFVIIGPFLSRVPSQGWMSDIIAKHKLPISERVQLKEFYQSLMVIDSNYPDHLGHLLVNLCGNPFIEAQMQTTEVMEPVIKKEDMNRTISESKSIIELRYRLEKKIRRAVSLGNKEEVHRLMHENGTIFTFPDRIPESPLRSVKNLSITLNTILRIAAEKGGVHPVYMHNISERFAITIERGTTVPYLKKLNNTMIDDYCDAVKMFSTRNYSSIVKMAVNYINLHLEHKISLKYIAEKIHTNPSHLSRQFKKETMMTITDYINKKRVEEAKLYLERENSSITDIALMVGFSNLNYFTKVFKKVTSLTPSEYIKEMKNIT
ncbi:helix-turn-helix domain-containing protein [Vallitalea okinawensis]|uniref:helix-turn-helix domain-containing protein n=1 Tax=Vallitalea okinawensis TaxID=2078660 RepID=UPI000CFC82AC|nr:helix-turn-helix domain-containing protein [Vallitalea okinawensis]